MKSKQHNHFTIIATSLIALASASDAAVLVGYNFTTDNTVASINASFTSGPEVTAGAFTAVGSNIGIGSDTMADYAFLSTLHTGSTQAGALADPNFFQVTISASNPGYLLNLRRLTFLLGNSSDITVGSFSNEVFLQSSIGGFGTGNPVIAGTNTTRTSPDFLVTFSASKASFDLSGAEFQGISSATFQIRFSDSVNAESAFNIFDDVQIEGTVIPEPSTALLGGLGLVGLLLRRSRSRSFAPSKRRP